MLSLQADFPANTNILYVDLPSVELVASSNDESSLPGMVLNTKKSIVYADQNGNKHRYGISLRQEYLFLVLQIIYGNILALQLLLFISCRQCNITANNFFSHFVEKFVFTNS